MNRKSACKMKASPKSNIDIVLDKLDQDIHVQLFGSASQYEPNAIRRRGTLVANGEEALRILQTKRASLMPKKDTPMVRAALVIDYISRNAPDVDDNMSSNKYMRTTIPITYLAKAVGFTKKDIKKLETMQTILASYLDGTFIGKKHSGRNNNNQAITKQLKRKQNDSNLAAASSSSTTFTSAKRFLSPSNLIRDLCIQLGPIIPDAEFATSYAMKLFDFLNSWDVGANRQQQQQQSKRKGSTYQLRQDLKRNQEYYEAACLYLAVKKSEGESSHLINANANSKKNIGKKKDSKFAKKKKDNDEGIGLEDDGGEEEEGDNDVDTDDRQLNEMDVIRAANLLESTFKTVLAYVKDLTEGVSISLEPVNREPTTKTLFEVQDTKKEKDDQTITTRPIHTDNAFEQWKHKVLQNAKESVMKKEGGDKDWLTLAADEVLRKAGIIN